MAKADPLAGIDVVPWSQLPPRMSWQQGEHVTLVGPTGQGKTTLLKSLLPYRRFVCVIATKKEDESLEALRRKGYRKISTWKPRADDERLLLWPKLVRLSDVGHQREVIRLALEDMFLSGSWCVALDEARYVCDNLRSQDLMEVLWLQARSARMSVVAATQRPRHLPLEAFSQATHLFLWGSQDKYDLDRLAGLGTISSTLIREALPALPRYHVLYVNTRDNFVCVTKAPAR